MYSHMSRRMIAFSSSNRNSASALVSSVLPTPVGPRNRNEPIGRFGSCRPARARRTASTPPRRASSWPTTRFAERVLHLQQLFALALQHLLDRNAGPARDDLRDLVRRRPPLRRPRRLAPSASASSSLLLELRDVAVGNLAGALKFAAALGVAPARCAAGRAALAASGPTVSLSFSAFQRRGQRSADAPPARRAPPRASPAARLEAGVGLLLQRLALDLQLHDLAVDARPAPRAWNRSACAAAPPPRRSGRSPCRAGSGR